jgi:hypothetical protein
MYFAFLSSYFQITPAEDERIPEVFFFNSVLGTEHRAFAYSSIPSPEDNF